MKINEFTVFLTLKVVNCLKIQRTITQQILVREKYHFYSFTCWRTYRTSDYLNSVVEEKKLMQIIFT